MQSQAPVSENSTNFIHKLFSILQHQTRGNQNKVVIDKYHTLINCLTYQTRLLKSSYELYYSSLIPYRTEYSKGQTGFLIILSSFSL